MANVKMTTSAADHERRMKWWRDGRFGMFIHWGLYAQLKRNEWVQNREHIPQDEYAALADTWKVKPNPAREWARLARQAGMKYMVLTTKHCDGYCLWDTQQTEFNSVRHDPHRDLVAEYVEAARAEGMKVGFYFGLMDWHHPDAVKAGKDEAARRRYVDFIHGCVQELMTNYGKIDLLWYDGAWPLDTPEKLESVRLNRWVRKRQKDIIINCRSMYPEDYGTPEGHIAPQPGIDWEACMTFNGDWGYAAYRPEEDWLPARKVLDMLRQVTYAAGNLLLNIGPAPDGSVPPEAVSRLRDVGKWLELNGEAVYGARRADGKTYLDWTSLGHWTRKDRIAYYWCDRWPDTGEIAIAGLNTKVRKASYLATGKPIKFVQEGKRVKLLGLPKTSPDKIAKITVIKLECADWPGQYLGMGSAEEPDVESAKI